MQFKHPEILYFLFLLVIPVLVHLFQLRRFRRQYFTNVRFLRELSIQTRKSSQLKKWLLLATRLLLLAAVIIAFAQPFFPAKNSRDVSNAMYIVLDNSFSMQVKGKRGELLKRAVQDLLESVPENSQFSLLTNSADFRETDIRSIRKELQDLDYSGVPFEPENVVTRINAGKPGTGRDVVVITDAVGLRRESLKGLDPESNAYFVIPKAENTNNIAIDSVYITQTLDHFYELGVKLTAYGSDFKDVPLALYNNEKLVAKTLVKFDAKTKETKFMIPKAEFSGYASVTDNGLDYDNRYYFNIGKPARKNVLSVGDDATSNFLARIFTGDEFTYQNSQLAALDYNLLEKQDVVVLNELKDIPQALQTTLKSFAQKGGNVILVPAADSPVSGMNSFLGNFGSIQLMAPVTAKKLVAKINFSHPLFASVFEKKIENFQYPEVKMSYGIKSVAPAALVYDDQSPFLVAMQLPASSVYVFAAPIDADNSNFQNSPLIVPTFYNMAQHGAGHGVIALAVGGNSPLFVDAKLSKDEILSVGNAFEKFIPVQQILNEKVKLLFSESPLQAGNYTIYNHEQKVSAVSFNYSRAESNITQPNGEAASQFKSAESIDSVFTTLQMNRTDNPLWRIFALLALLLLVTEILIQKFVK